MYSQIDQRTENNGFHVFVFHPFHFEAWEISARGVLIACYLTVDCISPVDWLSFHSYWNSSGLHILRISHWLNAFFTGLQIGSEQITRRCHRLNSSAEPTTPRCIKVHNFFNWWWWEGNGWLISRTRCTFFLSIHSFKFVVNIWRKKRFFCPSAKLVVRRTTKLKVRS